MHQNYTSPDYASQRLANEDVAVLADYMAPGEIAYLVWAGATVGQAECITSALAMGYGFSDAVLEYLS